MASAMASGLIVRRFSLAPPPAHDHDGQPCQERAAGGAGRVAGIAGAALRLAVEAGPAGQRLALLDRDLGDVLRDEVRQVDRAARRERDVRRGLWRPAVGDLDARRRSTPAIADRVLARDRTGPLVPDHVATLEVVHLRRRGTLLALAVRAVELAPADDRLRGAEHEVVRRAVLAVARVEPGQHEAIA